jgi:uncharacterized lipoprotein YddW (UPF0748 family)
MEVFAWFEYGLSVHHSSLGASDARYSRFARIAVDRGWTISQRSNGFLMLDPRIPEALNLIKTFMVECVQKYNSLGLAGIHLDDHICMPSSNQPLRFDQISNARSFFSVFSDAQGHPWSQC